MSESHSYRSLAISLLNDKISDEAHKHLPNVQPHPGESSDAKVKRQTKTVIKTLEILNYRRAVKWLESLPDTFCPDVQSAAEQAVTIIASGTAPQVAIMQLLQEFEEIETDTASVIAEMTQAFDKARASSRGVL